MILTAIVIALVALVTVGCIFAARSIQPWSTRVDPLPPWSPDPSTATGGQASPSPQEYQ